MSSLESWSPRFRFRQNLREWKPAPTGPPPTTPSTLPAAIIGRPVTTFRGKLIRTPDGNYIIGMSTVNNNAQTVLFVYEVSSASILRSRTVTGQSTVFSVSPDGSRFMAGFSLYDKAILNVGAQQSTSNIPFRSPPPAPPLRHRRLRCLPFRAVGVYTLASGYAAIYHKYDKPVTSPNPALRDEPLVMYKVQVFFGDPPWHSLRSIVDWFSVKWNAGALR